MSDAHCDEVCVAAQGDDRVLVADGEVLESNAADLTVGEDVGHHPGELWWHRRARVARGGRGVARPLLEGALNEHVESLHARTTHDAPRLAHVLRRHARDV